jgi:hypothetical protein
MSNAHAPAIAPVEIVPVTTNKELERFVRVPNRLNAGDPNWRTPLEMERMEALSPKHNPLFEHLDYQFFLAVRGGRDVGRISAQIDKLAPVDPRAPYGYFGMIAAEDDAEVFQALFAAAEAWLKARGCVSARGPFNLSISEQSGLLVDGFDTPPMVMMDHDPAYTARRVEAQGYHKIKDLYAYISGVPEFTKGVQARLKRELPAGMVVRPVDMKRFDAEVKTMVGIYNDAWSENWGFTPLTDAETAYMAKSLKMILHPRLMWMVEIDGEPAAFIILLPNLNEAIRDLGGKLFPFGVAKLLWRLKVKGVSTGRVPLMGVKRKFARDHRGRMAPFAMFDVIRREGIKAGIDTVELSWILENNRPMRHLLEAMGCRIYKTYRVYEKALA